MEPPHYSPDNLLRLKTKLRTKYPQLTNADLLSPGGNENDMLTMIAYKLRKTQPELLAIIAEL